MIILLNFKIPSIPPTTSKSIRFPNDIIERVEQRITGQNCTFTAFVVEAVRAVLDDLDAQSREEEKTKKGHS